MNLDYSSSRRTRSPRILIVEDDFDQHLLIGYSLRNRLPQAELTFASTTEEALDYLELSLAADGFLPKFVLLDLFLPLPENGFEALEAIKTRYKYLPVLVLSAYHEADTIHRAYELGANSVLTKPFDLPAWKSDFETLCTYWLNVVTLPPSTQW